MKNRSAALIVFEDRRGRFLLQDRRDMSKLGEEWGFFGGGIEPGETPQAAVERECMEELGYRLTDYRCIGVASGETNEWEKTNWVYVADLPPAKELVQKEGRGMALFTISEARKLKMQGPWDDRTVDLLEQYLLGQSAAGVCEV